jgi:putative aldouronate transport system substrate-binding protein
MKRTLLILSALLLVASGALFAAGDQETAATTGPKELELTSLYFFDNGDVTQNPDVKAEYVDWFSKQFNVNLIMHYYPRPEYMTKFSLALSSGEIHGFGRIFGGVYVDQYWNDGATVEISQYIEDNPNWQKLPQGMKDEYMRGDDLIGLPQNWAFGGYFVRAIRKDWLDKFGLGIPETVDDLYEAVKKFTLNDPDGNGEDDTVGMTSANTWNMQDIFHAFGVHMNHVGAHCFTPDPTDNYSYTDGMLKPQMKDCLEWLADVYQNGYMDPEIWTNGGSQMRDRLSSGYAGSAYYWNSWVYGWESRAQATNPDADFEPIIALTSDFAKEYTNQAGGYGASEPWILISGTKNPGEQANLLCDLFFGNDVARYSGRFGIYEKHWKFGPDGEIVRIPTHYNDAGNPVFMRGAGIFSGDLEPFFVLRERGYDLIDNSAAAERWVMQQKSYTAWYEDGAAKNLLYQVPPKEREPISETWTMMGADLERIFREEVTRATTGQATPEEAIESYRSQLRALGAQKALEEANAHLGRPVPKWKY